MIKAIIFDFDGVILDTVDNKGKAFVEIFSEYPLDIQEKIFNFHIKNIGKNRNFKIKYIIKNILKEKITRARLIKLNKNFSASVFKKVIKSKYIKGSKEFIIKNIKKYDYHLCTATPEKEIKEILFNKKINHIFVTVNGSPNKKANHIFKIIKEGKYKKKEVVFIGDSPNDYDAAEKTGINFFGLSNKFYKFTNVKNICNNFTDIEIKLNKLNNT